MSLSTWLYYFFEKPLFTHDDNRDEGTQFQRYVYLVFLPIHFQECLSIFSFLYYFLFPLIYALCFVVVPSLAIVSNNNMF